MAYLIQLAYRATFAITTASLLGVLSTPERIGVTCLLRHANTGTQVAAAFASRPAPLRCRIDGRVEPDRGPG